MGKKYFVAFNTHQKIGPQTFKKLLDYFGDLENVWRAERLELKKSGLKEEEIEAILEVKRKVDPDKEMERLKKLDIQVVSFKDPGYPVLLSEIYDPPALLYYKGKLPEKEEICFSVVGSRACTPYGRRATEEIVFDLASEGLVIVSGLALGIDSIAHKTALEAKGKTIAVLGNGLDIIYPYSHKNLAKEIVEKEGAIISEFPLGMPPLKQNFPQRNRIIAGLSQGVLVIEAAETSGALITAHFALEENREVFALPGSIYNPNSVGTNNLIKMGAHPLTSATDIFLELNIHKKLKKRKKEIKLERKEEEILLSLLKSEPVHIDKLVEESKLDIAVVNSSLITLEIKGLVKNIGGGQYIKV